jgi:hypothetical protein
VRISGGECKLCITGGECKMCISAGECKLCFSAVRFTQRMVSAQGILSVKCVYGMVSAKLDIERGR